MCLKRIHTGLGALRQMENIALQLTGHRDVRLATENEGLNCGLRLFGNEVVRLLWKAFSPSLGSTGIVLLSLQGRVSGLGESLLCRGRNCKGDERAHL